jgi:hypothetical protein
VQDSRSSYSPHRQLPSPVQCSGRTITCRPLALHQLDPHKLGYARTILPHGIQGNSKHSYFFLLHGRGMTLPSRENLKLQLPKENFSPDQRLENLKSSLRMNYKLAAKANRKSHYNNKRLYDRKAKLRKFQVKDLVCLYYPARKPGLTKKFYSPSSGPFVITRKISELNYEIAEQNNRRRIVHVNSLKRCFNSELWKPKPNSKAVRKPRSNSKRRRSENT